MQQKKTDLAVNNFNQSLKINGKNIFANMDLAIIYYLKGNHPESKKYLGIAKSFEPRLAKGIVGITDLEKEDFYWTDK